MTDSIRRASNECYFASIDSRTSWKIVEDSNTSRKIVLSGNPDLMLAGILEKSSKFTELGVTVIGKKTKTGLEVKIASK